MKVNLSLGQRLGLGFFLLIALVVLTVILGFAFARFTTQTSETIQANTLLYQQANQILQTSSEIAAVIDRMLLTRQTGGLIEEQLASNLDQLEQELTSLPARNLRIIKKRSTASRFLAHNWQHWLMKL